MESLERTCKAFWREKLFLSLLKMHLIWSIGALKHCGNIYKPVKKSEYGNMFLVFVEARLKMHLIWSIVGNGGVKTNGSNCVPAPPITHKLPLFYAHTWNKIVLSICTDCMFGCTWRTERSNHRYIYIVCYFDVLGIPKSKLFNWYLQFFMCFLFVKKCVRVFWFGENYQRPGNKLTSW